MKRKLSPLTPARNLSAPFSLVGRKFVKSFPVVTSFAFIVAFVGLSVTSVSAQTRTSGKSEERVRRVETREKDNQNEAVTGSNRNVVAQPPLVRKTALTYSPRSGNQSAERPSLTNDIVIISRAPENSRSANSLKAGAVSSHIPSIWPVIGPLRSGVGMRGNPFGGPGTEFHKGQDISAPTGTPVSVTADGIVVIARWVKGYGNGIYIDHGNGISTRYGHLSRIDVAEGQMVKQGQQLGLVGSTGRSTGPHLHYEVRINGQPISPLAYLPSLSPAMQTAPQADTQQRGVQH